MGPIFNALVGDEAASPGDPLRFERADGSDPWLEPSEDEWGQPAAFQLREQVATVVAEVEQVANELVPPFITEDGGRIVVEVHQPPFWLSTGRVSVAFEQWGRRYDFEQLGTGTQRWVAASVREACERLRRLRQLEVTDMETGEVRALVGDEERREVERSVFVDRRGDRILVSYQLSPAAGLLLVDEPELHLHPTAQSDVATWLVAHTRDGAQVLAATHSPYLLGVDTALAEFMHVSASPAGPVVVSVDDGLMQMLRDRAHTAGLRPGDVVQIARGVLVVEGLHDQLVLERFFGRELERARVLLLRLEGAGNAPALAESEFLARTRIPIRVLLDNTGAEAIAGRAVPSAEERIARRVLELAAEHHVDMKVVSFTEPDVIAALPEQVVRRAYPEARFDGWKPLVERFRNLRIPGFKTWALNEMGLSRHVAPTEFVMTILEVSGVRDRPAYSLQHAVNEALASIGSNSGLE
ncbi:MAG: AAA family ATPase [Actinomycetota bacterium]|nr:AAA family ATPase [Actinomycetota bacterium]